MTRNDALKILKLTPNYDEKSLSQAYKKRIREVHPDINPNLPNAEELAKKVNEAKELLEKELRNGPSNQYSSYQTTNTRSYNNGNKNYGNNYDLKFKMYKDTVLCKIYLRQESLNTIFFNESVFGIFYTEYMRRELEIYKEFISKISLCNSIQEIDNTVAAYNNVINKNIADYFLKLLDLFQVCYDEYIDIKWFRERRNFYQGKLDFNKQNSINSCTNFFLKVRDKIVEDYVVFEINNILLTLSDDSKYYLDDKIISEIAKNILIDFKFSIDLIMRNKDNIVSKKIKKYINKQKIKYTNFLIKKNYKILKLKTFARINRYSGFDEDIKKLNLEKYETKFNSKYIILETKVKEFKKYKEQALFISKTEKCGKLLIKKYRKCKDKKEHQSNYSRSIYYLSMARTGEIEPETVELLLNINFKNSEKDYDILEQIEQNYICKTYKDDIYIKVKAL